MESIAPEASQPSAGVTESRPGYYFPPDMWRDRLASFRLTQDKLEWYDGEVEKVKSKVEIMLNNASSDAVERVKLIDILCRLGVSYHFQVEIERYLRHIFDTQIDLLDKKNYDLYTVATVFRVFRQHGIKIPCSVFDKFKDTQKGRFKDSITNDPKGLLSLFEACHLSIHGEDILEEALAFTKKHLEQLAKSKPDIEDEITSALTLPLHKSSPRVKTLEFISFYENYEPRDDVLLRFAKLDYNRVQLLHQQEIISIYQWSNELDFASKLPMGRNRIIEFFYWSAGTYFEPKYAFAREGYTKVCYLITFLDDIYDTYGDFDELPILTDAMQRWDTGMIEQLPRDYMKHLYKAYLDTFDEFENHATRDGTSMAVSFTKDCYREFARTYMLEAEWIKTGYLPSFKESLEMGIITAGARLIPAASFIGMRELSLQAVQWLQDEPRMAEAAAIIGRYVPDLVTYKREEKCKNVTNAFSSYKREYKASDEETIVEYKRKIWSTWKTINEELMRQSENVPMEILMPVVNYARLMEVFYKDEDGLADGKHAEGFINSLFFDPVPL